MSPAVKLTGCRWLDFASLFHTGLTEPAELSQAFEKAAVRRRVFQSLNGVRCANQLDRWQRQTFLAFLPLTLVFASVFGLTDHLVQRDGEITNSLAGGVKDRVRDGCAHSRNSDLANAARAHWRVRI